MAYNKLHKKDFTIAVKTGTDANKTKFAKECVQGEMYFATDSRKLYVAEVTAGVSDATLSSLSAEVFNNTYGVDFDGTDDYMDTGNTFQSTFQSDFSVSLWFNPDNTAGGALGGVFGTERNYFYRDASTVRHFYYNGDVSIQNSGSISTSVGTWYHALVTIEQSGGNVVSKIYVNGSLLNTGTQAGNVSNYTSSLNYWLGVRNQSGISQPFNGKIDEAAIFGSALTLDQVNNIYKGEHNGRSGGTNGVPGDLSSFNPVGWWRMGDDDSGTGTTITDQGSGGNNGTLINGPTFHDLSTAPDSIYVA